MKNYKLLFISNLFLLVLLASCRKDNEINSNSNNTVYEPTPYIIERKPWWPQLDLPADNPLTKEGVELGRMLFYDPILSADKTISCASCHRQEFGFSDPRTVSVGVKGALGTRNSMPLHNMMWNKRFFWDGRVNSVHEQVLNPIQAHNEMSLNLFEAVNRLRSTPRYAEGFKKAFNAEATPEILAKALEQFVVTLISFDAKIDKLHGRTDTLNVISASALRGLNLFMKPIEDGGADCFHCHSNIPFFGTISYYDVMKNNGLDLLPADKGFGNVTGNFEDIGKFKVPSLRNVELTAPYMHDGRFETLEEVLDFYSSNIKLDSPNLDINIKSHNNQLNLTSTQKADIIEFLKTLTDTTFTNNPAFKNPF